MALETPMVTGVRKPNSGAVAKLLEKGRSIGVRQVRIACGLFLFSYIFSHFFNHALGNISYDLMERWLWFHIWWWRIPVVNIALYAAGITHLSLGLWALYQRRHFRYTAAELTQLVLGLSIPLLLASHFGVVRLAGFLLGTEPLNYARPLFGYWSQRPYMVAVQFVLITVAWTHACIGLYFWLRMKKFFRWAWPIFFAVAVLLPPLAMVGAHHGAEEVVKLAAQPQWRSQNLAPLLRPAQREYIDNITLFYFPVAYLAAILLVFVARGLRALHERRGGMVKLTYPDRQVRVPKGLSVLEASFRYRVPHASVCGGRARCSTCRIRVISDRSILPRPSRREQYVLSRVGAGNDSSIRLACQLRPQTDIAFIPVLPPHVGADFVRNGARADVGEERYIVSMFVDMRGSTKLAEARLPFDVIFLINRFLHSASQAVVDAGGQPNQFIGDGLLALFGLNVDKSTACRQALRAAALVAANVEYLNHQFASDLQEPIDFGIGIHGGDAIIGNIGFRDHTVFTAVGDSVNVAARLQDMTKQLNCRAIVSEEVCQNADIGPDLLAGAQVTIRGRDEVLKVRSAADPTVLASLLEPLTPAAADEVEEVLA